MNPTTSSWRLEGKERYTDEVFLEEQLPKTTFQTDQSFFDFPNTSTFGIALVVNDSSAFTALWTYGSLLSAHAAATARAGGRCTELFLQTLLPVLFLDFDILHTFCVPEDLASLLIDKLAGKCAIKTSLQVELDGRRPARVVPHSSSTREEIFQIFSIAQFLCKSRPNTEERLVRSRPALSLRLNRLASQTFSAPLGSWAPVAATQQTGVSTVLCTFRIMGTCRCVTTDWGLKRSLYHPDHWHLSLRHNRRVYHSIIL